MIFLLFSILFSTVTVLFFKVFDLKKVNTFQAIVFNYLTCAIMGTLIADKNLFEIKFWQTPWLGYSAILGVLFIGVFYAIALTAQKSGVSVSMVAAKLSVVIPVLSAILLYGESISLLQLAGIVLSLVSVFLISRKQDKDKGSGSRNLILPLIVFTGSGAIDTLLNYSEQKFIPPYDASQIVTAIFLFAFILGTIALVTGIQRGSLKWDTRSAGWGFLLGLPNYFSMYFLVKTLGEFNGSYIFPVNNIGIVGVSALAAWLLFKEHLSPSNRWGLFIAVLAIGLISLGK